MKQPGARSAPGKFWGYLGSKSSKNIGEWSNPAREARRTDLAIIKRVFQKKRALNQKKMIIDSKKTLQGGGLQSSQGGLKKRNNKTGRLWGHESSSRIPQGFFPWLACSREVARAGKSPTSAGHRFKHICLTPPPVGETTFCEDGQSNSKPYQPEENGAFWGLSKNLQKYENQ